MHEAFNSAKMKGRKVVENHNEALYKRNHIKIWKLKTIKRVVVKKFRSNMLGSCKNGRPLGEVYVNTCMNSQKYM